LSRNSLEFASLNRFNAIFHLQGPEFFYLRFWRVQTRQQLLHEISSFTYWKSPRLLLAAANHNQTLGNS